MWSQAVFHDKAVLTTKFEPEPPHSPRVHSMLSCGQSLPRRYSEPPPTLNLANPFCV